jgi:hypothetical protein
MRETGVIEVHTLSAPERRMLLEALASERAGEDALHVGHWGRDRVAASLHELAMAEWIAEDLIILSEFGRYLAELLASRLIRHDDYQLAC